MNRLKKKANGTMAKPKSVKTKMYSRASFFKKKSNWRRGAMRQFVVPHAVCHGHRRSTPHSTW